MRKFLVAAASAASLASVAGSAHAAVITFGMTFPETSITTFTDGAFGNDAGPGGFFFGANGHQAIAPTSAANQYIQFNAPVTLHSLLIGPCAYCVGGATPVSFAVNLYSPTAVLISSTLVNASSTPELVNFEESGVAKVVFSFQGAPKGNSFYEVGDVSYDLGGGGPGVPEPAIWALMISGFGLVGAGLRRHRPRTA